MQRKCRENAETTQSILRQHKENVEKKQLTQRKCCDNAEITLRKHRENAQSTLTTQRKHSQCSQCNVKAEITQRKC
jgi:hypothetical protein